MKILLINPPSSRFVYKDTNVKVGTPSHPLLTFGIIARTLLDDGHSVKILDLDLYEDNMGKILIDELDAFKPDYAGVTATTPVYPQMLEVLKVLRRHNPDITTVAGGVHITTFPKEALETNLVDIAVIGEGDFTFREILRNNDLASVKGIAYKKDGAALLTAPGELIKDLDGLPLPAWELYSLNKYKGSDLVERKSPCGLLETSRGCVFNCIYCNKSIFGSRYRVKSIERVIEEIKYMLKAGFKQIHIIDDGFSTNIERAKKICDRIVQEGLKFPWTLFNGVRVDRVDEELFVKLKCAGCWLAAFGIETGSQRLLDTVDKGVKLEQIRRAVSWAKKANIETFGFFMMGLPGETEETLQQTIDFAASLGLDLAKFDYTIPYPGTVLYNRLKDGGHIKADTWTKYICHGSPSEIYTHPDLAWEVIEKYYKKSYKSFYLRPKFILNRVVKSLLNGRILSDFKYFIQTKW